VLNVAFHREANKIIDRLTRLADRLDTGGYTEPVAGTDVPVSTALRELAKRVEHKLQTPTPPPHPAPRVQPAPPRRQEQPDNPTTDGNGAGKIDQPARRDTPTDTPHDRPTPPSTGPDQWAQLVNRANRAGYLVRNRYNGNSETDAHSRTVWISYDQDPEARIDDLTERVNQLPVVTPIFDDIAHNLGWPLPSTLDTQPDPLIPSPSTSGRAVHDPLTTILASLNAKLRPDGIQFDPRTETAVEGTPPNPTLSDLSPTSLATTFASLTMKLGTLPAATPDGRPRALPRDLHRTHRGSGAGAERRPPLVPAGVEAERATVGARVTDRVQSGRERAAR
jgi:hypothetical protein